MLQFILKRREELRMHPETRGSAVDCGPVGNRTTAHLNLTTPLAPMPRSIIAIIKGKKK
jgi:hypothetical protein